jgi:hypothetical protein
MLWLDALWLDALWLDALWLDALWLTLVLLIPLLKSDAVLQTEGRFQMFLGNFQDRFFAGAQLFNVFAQELGVHFTVLIFAI